MEIIKSESFRSHLGDFETTTSQLLRPQEARALLNFAALFHETVFLTDTALGDHQLIIESFRQEAHSGLFHQISRLAQEGILRFLYRDKVVVRGKVLFAGQPTISQIFEGWLYRDDIEWGGETGFTTHIDDRLRSAYYREVENLESRFDVIQRYDPDLPKQTFRHRVLEQLNTAGPSTLLTSVTHLPEEVQAKYFKATQDPWFTNAELWRALRNVPGSEEAIILHAHITQQCYADLTGAGQAIHDRSGRSLASFNLELKRKEPFSLEVQSTIAPPDNLTELLQSAPVQLQSPGIEMFENLSVEDVIAIRRRATSLFSLAARRIETPLELEKLRHDYLVELERYWNVIVARFEKKYPSKLLQPTWWGLFEEQQLPTLGPLYQKYGTDFVPLVIRFLVPVMSPFIGPLLKGLNYLGYSFMYRRTPENERLRSQLPPTEWRPPSGLGNSRGLLSLEGQPCRKAGP